MLTKKQEGFAQAVAAGDDQSKAYRANYDTQGSDNVVAVDAHKLANTPKVALRLTDLIAKALETSIPKEAIEDYVLGKLVDTIEHGSDSARATCLKLLGQYQGMYREVKEHREAALTDEQIIADLSGGDPAIAELLRKRLGI